MDELDEFMKALENVGIIKGWSDFINKDNENDAEKEDVDVG